MLGLSPDYQSLARWFLGSEGTDFAGFVHSSYPHLLPGLARDFASGSSLFLIALRSPSLLLPPGSLASPLSSSTSAAPASTFPHFPSSSAPAAPLMSSLLSASLVPWVPAGSSSVSSQALPGPHPFSAAPPPGFSFPAQPEASFFPPPAASSSAALPVPPSSSFRDLAVVPRLGVGVPSSSGVPLFPSYPSVPSVSGATASPSGWPPTPAFQYDPHAFPAPLPPADLLSDSDDCYPDDDPPLDPSSSPLSLDSGHSEYRRTVEYVCSLFPQAGEGFLKLHCLHALCSSPSSPPLLPLPSP